MSSSKRPRKDDDDNDGTYSPPPAAKLRRISSRSSQFDSQLSDVSDKHSTAKRTLSKTTVPVRGEYWDRNLTQLSKIMKLLKDLNIDERSVLRVDSLLEKTLDSFFDVDLPSGKAAAQLWVAQKSKGTQGGLPVPTFTSKAVKDGRKRWTLVLNGPNRSKINLNFTEDDIVDFENMAVRFQLANLLERFYNAFASYHPVPTTYTLHADVVQMALARVDSLTKAIATPSWTPVKGFYANIPFVDEVTGERQYFDFTSASGYTLSRNAPLLPATVKLYVKLHGGRTTELVKDPSGQWPSQVPADILDGTATTLPKHMPPKMDPSKLLGTEKLMRICSWKMSNLHSTTEKMRVMRNHLVHTFTTSSEGTKGKSALTGLFKIYRDVERGFIKITPGAQMVKGLVNLSYQEADKLRARIQSLDTQWTAVVIEYANKVYDDTGSMFETLIEAATIVDLVNAQIRNGLEPPTSSYCTPDTPSHLKNCTRHKCSVCWKDVDCDQRKRTIDGLWVDAACWDKEQAKGGQGLIRTKAGLKRSHIAEAKSIGQDPDDEPNKIIYDRSVADIERRAKAADPGSYVDGYSGSTHQMYLGHHPFNNVVDCVLPSNRDHRGQLRGHVEGNLLETSSCLNFGKGSRERNLPADVAAIADYYCQSLQLPSGEEKSGLKMTLLEACNNYNLVQCKHRMNPAARLGQEVDAATFAAMRAEFLTGKSNRFELVAKRAARKHAMRMLKDADIVSCGWDIEDVALVKHYGTEAGVQYWADDGAPWPFPDVPMDSNFKERGMDMLYSFLRFRLNRMKIICNRFWVTIDTELSLCAEMFFQVFLDPDGEFLGLPVSPYLWHALLMSVGHRHHGKQMRTGYEPRPASVFDRDASLSNIVFETVFSNNFKWDFAEEYYPDMRSLIAKVVVPEEFYDPKATAVGDTGMGQGSDEELDYDIGITYRRIDSETVQEHNDTDGDKLWVAPV